MAALLDGKCENVKLQMGDYLLNSNKIAREMGGYNVVLGVGWLHTLGHVTPHIA